MKNRSCGILAALLICAFISGAGMAAAAGPASPKEAKQPETKPTATVATGSATYDQTANAVMLGKGIHTLASIYSQINNPSVLSHDAGTNTYTLSANICEAGAPTGKYRRSGDASLILENAVLTINSTSAPGYEIKIVTVLIIRNMTIKAANPSFPWLIRGGYSYDTCPYVAEVTDSDFSGGRIAIKPWGSGAKPKTPVVVKNNKFHDISLSEQNNGRDLCWPDGVLELSFGAGTDARILNNTFENCHVSRRAGNPGPAILFVNGSSGCRVDGVKMIDCSVKPIDNCGGVHFYGISVRTLGKTDDKDVAVVSNVEMTNVSGSGSLSGKEWGNIVLRDCVIKKSLGKMAIHLYRRYNPKYYDKSKYWIWNVTIDEAPIAIGTNCWEDWNLADIYDVKISNVGTAYRLAGNSVFYVTNTLVTGCKKKYNLWAGQAPPGKNVEVREYELADIFVKDADGKPVAGATITIKSQNDGQSVNRVMSGGISIGEKGYGEGLQELKQTHTLANGHTPLPKEDSAKTIALLRFRKTLTQEKSDYSYTITAEKDGRKASVTVKPDVNWYRKDPNKYPEQGKGSIVVTLVELARTGK